MPLIQSFGGAAARAFGFGVPPSTQTYATYTFETGFEGTLGPGVIQLLQDPPLLVVWSPSSNAEIVRSTDYAHTGTYSAKFTPNSEFLSWVNTKLEIPKPTSITASAWIYIPSETSIPSVNMYLYDDTQSFDVFCGSVSITDSWVNIEYELSPEEVAQFNYSMYISFDVDFVTSDSFYFDDVHITITIE